MKYFDAPVPGGKISAENLKNIYNEVRRGNNFTVEGATLHDGVGGSQLNVEQKKEFWGRITGDGTGGRYSWEQVEPNADGTGWITSESQFTGSSTYNPAIEAGLSASVAIGTVVRLSGPFYGYAVSDNTPEFYIFQSAGASASSSNTAMITISYPLTQSSFICLEITGTSATPLSGYYTNGSTAYTAYMLNYSPISFIGGNNYKVTKFPSAEYFNNMISGRIFLGYKIGGVYFFWADEADPPAQICAAAVYTPESGSGSATMQAARPIVFIGASGTFNMDTSIGVYLINPNQDGDFVLDRRYIANRIGWRTVTSGYFHPAFNNYRLPVYAAHPFGPTTSLVP